MAIQMLYLLVPSFCIVIYVYSNLGMSSLVQLSALIYMLMYANLVDKKCTPFPYPVMKGYIPCSFENRHSALHKLWYRCRVARDDTNS